MRVSDFQTPLWGLFRSGQRLSDRFTEPATFAALYRRKISRKPLVAKSFSTFAPLYGHRGIQIRSREFSRSRGGAPAGPRPIARGVAPAGGAGRPQAPPCGPRGVRAAPRRGAYARGRAHAAPSQPWRNGPNGAYSGPIRRAKRPAATGVPRGACVAKYGVVWACEGAAWRAGMRGRARVALQGPAGAAAGTGIRYQAGAAGALAAGAARGGSCRGGAQGLAQDPAGRAPWPCRGAYDRAGAGRYRGALQDRLGRRRGPGATRARPRDRGGRGVAGRAGRPETRNAPRSDRGRGALVGLCRGAIRP